MEHLFPPYFFLKQVLDHCPKAGTIYLSLWAAQDKNHKVFAPKDRIRADFGSTITRFRNELFFLSKEGLVSVVERPKTFEVYLVQSLEELE